MSAFVPCLRSQPSFSNDRTMQLSKCYYFTTTVVRDGSRVVEIASKYYPFEPCKPSLICTGTARRSAFCLNSIEASYCRVPNSVRLEKLLSHYHGRRKYAVSLSYRDDSII